ncbi:IclR family transcriptional regulator [Kitasatospora sp. MAP5-34]|uniref:IclR family transcriptional regulator n=1 Tax=Kitasatospora sp. MAP5-34 TaxID=3035102 RepID=UPI0024739B86|nr:IclR family transcriptional regulator [Kitasatospora sp. MAP5-34]MDH6580661.1 DNA-binding IclR family transcriptional regulator [Kitasatospora sp. MAP5-34]
MNGTDRSSGVGVLDKTSLLLGAVEAGPASLSALVAITGISRPTVHRLAIAMERLGLLARDTAGRFTLGPRLARLSVEARQNHLVPAADPVLSRLRDLTGLSARLYLRRGTKRVCVLSVDSPAEPADAVPVGSAFSLRTGSSSQVLLAWEEPDRLYEGLQGARFSAGMLSCVRRQGWAQSFGEDGPGIVSLSAPVRGADSRVLAAVALSGPVTRLSSRPGRRYAGELIEAASRIEAGLPR